MCVHTLHSTVLFTEQKAPLHVTYLVICRAMTIPVPRCWKYTLGSVTPPWTTEATNLVHVVTVPLRLHWGTGIKAGWKHAPTGSVADVGAYRDDEGQVLEMPSSAHIAAGTYFVMGG